MKEKINWDAMEQKNFEKIIEHYGKEHQVKKCLEELRELSYEIMILLESIEAGHGIQNEKRIIDELADVLVMTEQMMIIFGYSKVYARAAIKVDRTLKRIEEEKNGRV